MVHRHARIGQTQGDVHRLLEAGMLQHRQTLIVVHGQHRVALRKARGVDWVRTSDLMARGTGQISRLAIDFEANLAHKAHDGLARGVTRLGAKERELPPISAFGRSTSRDGAGRGPVGMN